MKNIILCCFLVFALAACSESQQDKVNEINEKNAQKASDYIQKPIDQAEEVRRMTEDKYKNMEKQ